MHYPLFMHVPQRACNLMYVLPDPLLRKAHVLLYCLFDDQLQVPLLRPLHCDKQLVQLVVDEPVQVLDDVRVV